MGALQPWHLIILVLLVVVLFGAKRLPDAARSIGKSMKIFKAETKDMRGSGESEQEATDAEPKQLATPQVTTNAAAPATPGAEKDQQLADLQRQLDELKKQQPGSAADQTQRNPS
ncbi:preprotein translocase subunit TatA [Prauserella marina]|uniref:Sec-independent protein translocase protein TatA n=1 Tax=Prauserella marina TaxID=530584 RepID=A0A222VR79_9PSEU|nr:Sec-independent protein translocase subunit TatA [Prauserella marina]ASR36400.1 preprotein translocase subunit TatA [Prauserella marina]PWV77205.1 sec-independent protein translocase protein TatA [Prauserella marina]SDD06849.1 sec-independent protein translocase protein TatA [Prauserella marina]